MSGICIVSGTNRKESKTYQIANIYQQVLIERGITSELLDLVDLPHEFAYIALNDRSSEVLNTLIQKYVQPYQKFIFISPEYNGSFPGILKVFLDAVPPKFWTDKKSALVGVSDGRAGNLRGMEHLTNILNHLKINVYHHKIPVSQVSKILEEETGVLKGDLKNLFLRQSEGLINF